ncbi:hypothetical protein V6N11_054398 [Hibiscus sabdariffa]|uniref:Hexosyltransferase n=1 Tax=Hibiscus sabdariffa TaxID=183260 RepID=A0ABR2S3S7_9ROSI
MPRNLPIIPRTLLSAMILDLPSLSMMNAKIVVWNAQDLGLLSDFKAPEVVVVDNDRVQDYALQDGSWDWNALAFIFIYRSCTISKIFNPHMPPLAMILAFGMVIKDKLFINSVRHARHLLDLALCDTCGGQV